MHRLLILCEYSTLLGGERSMLATLPALTSAGFDAYVAAPPNGPLADTLRERGIPHISWPTHDAADERLPLLQLRSNLTAIFDRTRPDLVHANSLSTARVAGPPAAHAGLRSIGHLRDILKLSRQFVGDLNRHTRLIAVSHATRAMHIAQGIDLMKCVTIHNGVDLTEFRPRPASAYLHRELGLPHCVRLVVSIGQLGLRKATDVALAAAAQAANEIPDVHWLIVGERTSTKAESHGFEAALRSMAAAPPLAGRVHFLGSRGDVPKLMNECVLIVHAARQEPLGRVLLEAAASGLPAVATDVGGTREIYPSAEAAGALLVPPDNREALADAVTVLLSDEPRRRSLSEAARRRAEQSFDIRSAATRLIEQYREVLAM